MVRLLTLYVLSLAAALWPICQTLAADDNGRALAATCTGCHGPNGASAGAIPSIAGMETERLVALMRDFRDGKREATVMHQHARGYTDEQVEAMAAWFAQQRQAQPR
jgi:cytochrome c553